MQHLLPDQLERDIAKAYEAGDLASAIESLTAAFRNRGFDNAGDVVDPQHSKIVTDYHNLVGPGGPEGETADDFLKPIYEQRDAAEARDFL